ncbi:MAG: GNAT family N-acetyltransferase [Leptospiraceae bacterium]|nr:GNAT family N-acetyltransferase [Leptospiraceae bacterium]
MQARIFESLTEIPEADWNALVPDGCPFLLHGFLHGLHVTGCVGSDTGWMPRYLVVTTETNKISAALVFYIKTDSYGEYIFDWDWASAWHRAGLDYYPKITVAIPFSPVNVPKFLFSSILSSSETLSCAKLLIQGLMNEAEILNVSGIHFLFVNELERTLLEEAGFLHRITRQYHWQNYSAAGEKFQNFDDWLGSLRSHRRKEIKREREKLKAENLQIEYLTGDQLTIEHMLQMYGFYLNTHQDKWGQAYLNREFFVYLAEKLRENTLLTLAKKDGEPVAATLSFFGGKALYGRYWGCSQNIRYLHFDLSYYRLIDFAITRKLDIFEAGAQGEHKFMRGFDAVEIHSMHTFFHPHGRAAIAGYLERERAGESRYIRELNREHSQIRKNEQ